MRLAFQIIVCLMMFALWAFFGFAIGVPSGVGGFVWGFVGGSGCALVFEDLGFVYEDIRDGWRG